MSWTMPRPVLQAVAGVLALGAVGSFAMGIVNAPQHGGRLPGERAAGEAGGPVTAIEATEATPLSQERIEGPPPAAPKAVNTTADEDTVAADQATNTVPTKSADAAKPAVPAAQTPSDKIGDVLQNAAPPPEDPPH